MEIDMERQNANELLRNSHALASMDEALEALQILQVGMQNGENYLSPLEMTFVIAYARPFMKSNAVGTIKTRFIPNDSKNYHAFTIALRNSIFGHTGHAVESDTGRTINGVSFHVINGSPRASTGRVSLHPEEVPALMRMVEGVAENLEIRNRELMAVLPEFAGLTDGVYTFDVTQPVGKMLTRSLASPP